MINQDHLDVERKVVAILGILKDADEPMGARIISRHLKDSGIDLTERAVRYHLKLMDERGLTEGVGRDGRRLAAKGVEELKNALVADKVDLVMTKIESLSYRTTFDPDTGRGKVILNASFFPKAKFDQALEVMAEVFKAKLALSDLVDLVPEGRFMGELEVPPGMVGFGTVCSFTLNGIMLKHGIPIDPKFGGILEMQGGKPKRFIELISYRGTSLDPLEVFIRSQMTDVTGAAKAGWGKILASFREIPVICHDGTCEMMGKLAEFGLGGLIAKGKPGHELLDIPVEFGRIGIVVIGGLNPLAAVEEAGIVTHNRALSTLVDYGELRSFWDL
jgi:repressor of nif and glnA expression